MEIKYFKLIKTIEEEGSIANSANKLFLTQSALSHQLRELELRLGFKVFYRTRNQWELTPEGEELYRLSNAILNRIEQGFDNIKQLQRASVGEIRVSTECYSLYQGVCAFIQRLAILYPDIKVELIIEATHHPMSKLLSHEIDIAIVTNKPEDPDLLNTEVFEDEVFAIVHKENPLSKWEYLEAEHFSDIHLIIHSYPLETVSVYNQFLKYHKIEPQKISAIPFTEVGLEMVSANMGVMCMPIWALKAFNLSDELNFIRIGLNGLKRKHYLVYRSSDSNKKYIKDFVLNFKEAYCKV